MFKYYNKVLDTLDCCIDSLEAEKNSISIIRNPTVDFSRNRKLNFNQLLKTIIFMAGKPIKEELYDYFDYSVNVATSSAFVQARDKLLPNAFQELFYLLNNEFQCVNKYKGFRLLAVDGSDLSIPLDIHDTDTLKSNGDGAKPSSMFHINSSYDILNQRYDDIIINDIKNGGEQAALCSLVDRYTRDKAIFIADRNYPTWNVMEHINKANQYFLIRSKDIHSYRNILGKFDLPDTEFDLDISTTLTNVNNKLVKASPDKYRFLSTTSTFDYLDENIHFYEVNYRVVRFIIDGNEKYESILTNLPREIFTPEVIKYLYNLRWSIEVSFRHLKYAVDLKSLHSKKRSNIQQEIWARAILYNLSQIIIIKITDKKKIKKGKWDYTINITRAIHLIRDMIKRKGGIPPDLETIISKEVLPIRPNRKFACNVRPKTVVHFNYRYS